MTDTFRNLSSLWKYTIVGKKRCIPAIMMMIVASIIFATIPVIARSFIDDYSTHSGTYDIGWEDFFLAALALIAMVAAWYLLYTRGRTIEICDVSGRKLRNALTEKAERMSVATLEDRRTGDYAAIMANDVPEVISAMRNEIPNFFVQLALLLFIAVMMVYLNIYLAIVYIFLFIVSYVISRNVGKRMYRQMEIKQDSMGELNGYFNDSITSHSLVKIYCLEDRIIDGFREINEVHSRSYVRTTSAFGFVEPIGRIIDNVGFFVTAVMGAFMIINGDLSFGTFLAFISYAAIIGRPLTSFANSVNRLQSASVAYGRITEFLDEPEMPNESAYDDIDVDAAKGGIVFDDVSFSYPDGNMALTDVGFEIRPGSIVTIIGEEGSGKSTVSDLIMGFRTATEGRVLLDGKDIADVKRSRLRSVIGMSSQNPFVFEGTVYYNLSVTASEEEIERISKLTGFDECVKRLPKGYRTVIGGRGYNLSSGERQLLAITRLILHDPKVMIFDESSSEMDPLTTMSVFRSMRGHLKDKTLIIVDNTPMSVLHSDMVIFMSRGRVSDVGTHSELMDRNPEYMEMYRNMTC